MNILMFIVIAAIAIGAWILHAHHSSKEPSMHPQAFTNKSFQGNWRVMYANDKHSMYMSQQLAQEYAEIFNAPYIFYTNQLNGSVTKIHNKNFNREKALAEREWLGLSGSPRTWG